MMDKVRVPDIGYLLLTARLVGEIDPGLVFTLPVDEVRFVDEECVAPDGTVTRERRLITDEERLEMVEMDEDYLTEAGVAPFPRGVAVYLTLPSGIDTIEELAAAINRDTWDMETTTPDQMAAALRQVLPGRYPAVTID